MLFSSSQAQIKNVCLSGVFKCACLEIHPNVTLCNRSRHMKTETGLTVDDGRHGQDDAIAVVDDGVHRLVFNNMKIMPQVVVCL